MKNIILSLLLGFTVLNFGQTTDTIKNHTFKLDEVIISTAFNKLQSQNVMKVEHQKIKDLQKNGANTLIDGLTTVAGISQVSTGIAIGKPIIRGLGYNRVLTYTQGIRLENQQFGDEHGLGLNDSGIESVEIIKGPASLLYGSDAMGGVLFFNPEKFAEPNLFKADFSQKYLTNTLGSKTDLGLKYSKTNWSFLVRGAYDTHSDYENPENNRLTNSRFNETDFKTAIGYKNSKISSIIRYNFNKLDIGIPENGIDEQTITKNTEFPRQGITNNLISFNNIINLKNSKIDANFGYINNDRKEFEDNYTPILNWKLNTFSYDIKYHLPKKEHLQTIFGISGMSQTNTNFGEEFLIPDATTTDFGVFGTTNFDWKKNTIQVGIRFDNRKIDTKTHGIFGDDGYLEALNKNYNSINAMLGYKYNIENNLIFRLNIATGFRTPNLSELTSNGVHEGTFRYEIGNKNLNTEQNIQTDINLEYKNSHFEFFINGFYNTINNYVYLSPDGSQINGFDVYNYLQNNANLYGGEIGIHFHPHPIDWLHFETSFDTTTAKKSDGEYLPLIPANKWNNNIRTDFKIKNWLEDGYFLLNISTTFNQNNVSNFETKSNDYTLLNIGTGGKIKWSDIVFNFSINANNLFNKTYISHLSRLKNDGIPNIGRNIIFGINFNL